MSDGNPMDSDDADRTVLRPSPGGVRRPPPPAAPSPPGAAPPAAATPPAQTPVQSEVAPPIAPAAGNRVEPSLDNPPGDADRTVMRPAGRPAAAQSAREPVLSTPRVEAAALQSLAGLGGINPLVGAANGLLDLVPVLRAMPEHSDLEGLRAELVRSVKEFESEARARSVPTGALAASRYAVCTLLDETINSTPWGGGGAWAGKSLLVTFHNEAWGGEKFFKILDKLSEDARANIDVLELMYVCLALGFEGRYRPLERGREQIEALREQLFHTIRNIRGAPEPGLSPHWEGVEDRRQKLAARIPLWVVAAAVVVFVVLLRIGFGIPLSSASDPVFSSMSAVKVAPLALATGTVKPPVKPTPRLTPLLQPLIDKGLISVAESDDKSTITLHGDGMFASGSTEISPSYVDVIRQIAEVLTKIPGEILVTGHTDNQPIVSLRFKDNWQLSKQRADNAARLLARQVGGGDRVTAAGRGDTEPLVDNDTPAKRAQNRRVDITLSIPANLSPQTAQ